MQTKQISRNEWPLFLDGFSRRHEGWLVTLEVFSPEIGDQIEERELALEGITAELAGDEKDRIEIMIGVKPDDHMTHTIANPTEVSLEQTDEGADEVLAIKGGDAATTLLRICSAVRAEMVDGVV